MLRKTLIALSAAAALGVSSGAMAAQGMHGGSGSGGVSMPSSAHGPSTLGPVGNMGPGRVQTMGPSRVQTMGPNRVQTMGPNRVQAMGPSGNWQSGTWSRHHHHHHRNAFFFGVGFAGPYYDYGYDSCWRIVPTYWGGWQRVWVCGDYPYWGY
jgi:hypothetical protein